MDLDRTTAARGSFRVSHPSIHAQWLYLVDEMPSGSFGSLWSSAVVIELFELPGVLTQSCTGLFHVDCPIEREWANRCFQSISEDRSINWSPRLQFPVKSSGSQVHTQNYTQRKAQWASEKRELRARLAEGSSVPSASWQRVLSPASWHNRPQRTSHKKISDFPLLWMIYGIHSWLIYALQAWAWAETHHNRVNPQVFFFFYPQG